MTGAEISQHQPRKGFGASLTEGDKKRLGKYEAWAKDLNPRYVFRDLKKPKTVDQQTLQECWEYVLRHFERSKINNWGVVFKGDDNYPEWLEEVQDELQYFYYQGNLELLKEQMVSVVGTRRATKQGLEKTRRLVRGLVEKGYTIVSGLAKGIDAMAHRTALENKGNTIAVIGNPLWQYYPIDNKNLQRFIGEKCLIISQVPVSTYSKQSSMDRKYGTFLKARNVTMAALSQATIVMEGDSKSGTYSQVRAALELGRKVFIDENVFIKNEEREKAIEMIKAELQINSEYYFENISAIIKDKHKYHQDLAAVHQLVKQRQKVDKIKVEIDIRRKKVDKVLWKKEVIRIKDHKEILHRLSNSVDLFSTK